MTEYHVIDFPKIKSPFIRKKINGRYVVTPEIEEGYNWVFEDNGVLAVDKLHGTNICCVFDNGRLIHIDNRKNRIISHFEINSNMPVQTARMIEGVITALEQKWIPERFTGRMYGELIGPSYNGNIHKTHKHAFVPFRYLQSKFHWKSWISNSYPKTFESISEWFKDLPSLFTKRMTREEHLAEGLVFTHPDGRMAKLRRDMFNWYQDL